MIYLKNKLWLLILMIFISCSSQIKQIKTNHIDNSLLNLFDALYQKELVKFKNDSQVNFHCKKKYLNKEAYIIEIFINNYFPNKDKKIVKYFKTKYLNNIFIYGKKKDKKLIAELKSRKLISNKEFSHSKEDKYLRILVSGDNNNQTYNKLTPLEYWSKNKNEEEEDW